MSDPSSTRKLIFRVSSTLLAAASTLVGCDSNAKPDEPPVLRANPGPDMVFTSNPVTAEQKPDASADADVAAANAPELDFAPPQVYVNTRPDELEPESPVIPSATVDAPDAAADTDSEALPSETPKPDMRKMLRPYNVNTRPEYNRPTKRPSAPSADPDDE